MPEDPTYELALALTDHRRTFRSIGEAFIAAADAEGDLDGYQLAGHVTRGLVDRYMMIDQIAIAQGLAAIVGYLAKRTGKTPRQVHDDLFRTAPSDEWWHARAGDLDDEGDRR